MSGFSFEQFGISRQPKQPAARRNNSRPRKTSLLAAATALVAESLERRSMLAVAVGGLDEQQAVDGQGVLVVGADPGAGTLASTGQTSTSDEGFDGGCCPVCGAAWCVAHMDQAGNIYYAISPVSDPNMGGAPDAFAGVPSPAPLADTFKLHSRPSATKVIYLDFDGHTTTGTAWKGGATIVTPEYNVDATAGFSDTELANIQNIWARTVEDFAPFDVDVTTEEPALEDLRKFGAGDERWGIRVVVGPDAGNVAPGAGGVAYLTSFNWDSDTPTFVFNDRLGNNNKNIAEAVSHEVGHTLGLSHDGRISPSEGYYTGQGTGPTGWAPIMGVGYYKDLVQWSKGEYTSANNKEDDLAIITTQNGFTYRPDDFGSTLATATTPAVADGTSISLAGVIERTTDVDVFKFFTLSAVQATILPAAISPNLDILAEIWDATGAVLFTSNPADALTASFSQTVSPGWYYLALHGTGKGDALATGYTDYASLGQYTVSMTVVSDNTPPAPPVITSLVDDKGPTVGSISSGNKTDDDTPTIGGTSEAKSTVQVFAGATLLGTAIATGDGTWSVNLGPLAEGTYSLTAVATDLAGNTGAASTPYAVTIDLTPPPAPVITGVSDDVDPTKGPVINGVKTNDSTPTISGTAPALTAVSLFNGGTLLGQTTSDAAGNWSLTPMSLPDGAYAFSARTIDDVGNSSDASAARTLTIDTVTDVPTITSVVAGGNPLANGTATNKTVLVFNGTAEPGSLVTLRANGVVIGTTTAATNGNWSLAASALAPSATPYIFTAAAVDNVGNPSSGSSPAFSTLVDLTPPDAPLIVTVTDDAGTVTGPIINGGRTNDATPTLSGTAEPASTLTIYNGATQLNSTTTGADGKWSITLAALADGTYKLRAIARDAAGNDSELSAPEYSITIDQTPPAVPVITGVADDVLPIVGTVAPNGSTNDPVLFLSGTAEPGMAVVVTAGATVIGTTSAGNDGKWSLATQTLADAVYNLTVQAIDDVGNASAASPSYKVTVDTSAAAPVIASVTDDFGNAPVAVLPNGVTNDTSLLIAGTAEPGSTITIRNAGFLVGSIVANGTGDWSFTTSGLAAGTYLFIATQVDTAGNVSPASSGFGVTLDLTPPATPAITAVTDDVAPEIGNVLPGGTTNDNRLGISGVAEAGSTVRIFDGVTLLGTTTAAIDGKWTFSTAVLAAGVHSFTATARDLAGNDSPASAPAYSVTVKLTAGAPAITGASDDQLPVIGNVSSGGTTNDPQPLLSGTADPGSTVTISVGSTIVGTTIANGAGAWQVVSSPLPEGVNSLVAVAVDLAGNVSAASAPYVLNVDLTKPVKPSISTIADDVAPLLGNVVINGVTNDTLPTISGTAEPNLPIVLRNNGVPVGTTTASAAGTWSITLATPLADNATPKFTVVATDLAGNESEVSDEFGIRIDLAPPAAPSVTNVIDDIGSVTGGVADNATTDDPLPEIRGTSEPNARVSIFLNDLDVGSVVADNSGAWSFIPAAPLADGVYVIKAVATDAAGNTGLTSAARGLNVVTSIGRPLITGVVDDVGPKIGLVPSGTGTDDPSPEIRGTAVPGSSVAVTLRRVSDNSVVETGSATIDMLGAWSYVPNVSLPAGAYEISAVATDPAGNVSLPSSPGYVVTVDFTRPNTPSILGANDDVGLLIGDLSSGARSNDAQPTLFGKAEAGVTVRVFLGGSSIGSATADAQGDWRFTTSALPEGQHSFTARAIDSAGWQSELSAPSFELTIDLTPLGVPSISGGQDDVAPKQGSLANNDRTNDRTPTLMGTAAANARVDVLRNGVPFGTTTANGSGEWALTAAADLGEGPQTFTAFTVDNAGNASVASAPLMLVIDTTTTTPAITGFIDDQASTTGPVADGGLTNDATPTILGSAEPNSVVTVKNGTATLGLATADALGVWSLPITVPLVQGTLLLSATAADPAGNASAASAIYTVTLDTQVSKPSITAVMDDVGTTTGLVANDGFTDDSALTISGTADAGSIISLTATPDIGGPVSLGSVVAGADGAWTFNSSALPAARYTLTATATDAAGNTSAPSDALIVRIDTSTARPFITAVVDDVTDFTGAVPNGGRTNDAKLQISGTAEALSTVVIRSGTSTVATATADNDGAWTATTADLSDGTNYLTAVATDRAGNQSTVSPAYTVVVDATAPGKAVISLVVDDVGSKTGSVPAGGRTNDNRLTLTGTAEAGATVVVKAGSQNVGTTTADNAGNWSLITSLLPESQFDLTASAMDAAGNVGPTSDPFSLTVDITAPAAPAGIAVTSGTPTAAVQKDGRTKDPNVTISGTAPAQTTVIVKNNATVIGTATAAADGAWSFSAVLADGDYNLVATANDDVGNESVASSGYAFVVDATAPAAPRITGVMDSETPVVGNVPNGGQTNDQTLVLTGSAEPGSTVQVFDGGVSLGFAIATNLGGWSYPTAALPIGERTFTAQATDTTGNAGALSAAYVVKIDRTAPVAPAITAITDDAGVVQQNKGTRDRTLVVSGTAEAGTVVVLYRNGNIPFGTATTDANGTWSVLTSALPDGEYVFSAKAADQAGNESVASATYTVSVDTVVATPAIARVEDNFNPTQGLVLSGGVTNDATPTIQGNAEPNSTVTVRNGATALGTATTDGSGSWSLTPTLALADGTYALTATVTDIAGNVSSPSAVYTIKIDTSSDKPVITGVVAQGKSLDNGGATSGTAVTVSGTAEPGATVTIGDGLSALATALVSQAGVWSIPLTGLTDGSYSLTAKAVDLANNESDASLPFVITIDNVAPAIPVIANVFDDRDPANPKSVATGTKTADDTLLISGTAAVGSTVTVNQGATVLGTRVAGADGKWSLITSVLPQGLLTFTAVASDLAGNTSSPSAPYSVTVDSLPPAKPTIIGPVAAGGVTNQATPTFTGAAETDSSVVVTIKQGANPIQTLAPVTAAAGAFSATPATPLAEGSYTVTVVATDSVGNVSLVSEAYSFSVDTTKPNAPAFTKGADDVGTPSDIATGGRTNDATLTLSGTAEAGSSVVITIKQGGNTIQTLPAVIATAGAFSATPTTLAEGTYSATAVATDAAGNASVVSAAFTFTVDTTPENQVTNLVVENKAANPVAGISNGGLTKTAALTISGNAPAGTTVNVFDGQTPIGTNLPVTAGAWSLPFSFTDGLHSLTAVTVDDVGNAAAPTAPFTFTVDTVAPAKPTITQATDNQGSLTGNVTSGGVTDDSSILLAGTADAGTTIVVALNGNDLPNTAVAVDGSWSLLVTLSNGLNTFTARSVDAAGNSSTPSDAYAVTLDTTPPTVPVIAGVSDNVGATSLIPSGSRTNDTTPTITVTTGSDATAVQVLVRSNGSVVQTLQAVLANGSWSATTSALADGTYSLTAVASDSAGNATVESAVHTIIVDTTVATPTIISVTDDVGTLKGLVPSGGLTDDALLSVAGTAEAGSSVDLFHGGVRLGTAIADNSGNWSLSTPSLPSGTYGLTAIATDPAGNASQASNPYTVVVDLVAPAKPTIDLVTDDAGPLVGPLSSGGFTDDNSLAIAGSAEPGTVVVVSSNGTPIATATADLAGAWSTTTPILAQGQYALVAAARDQAGNESVPSAAFNVTIDRAAPLAPVMTGILDDVGAIRGKVANGGFTDDAILVVEGDAESNSQVTVTVRNNTTKAVVQTLTATSIDGKWSATTTSLDQGDYAFTARAIDLAGNQSELSSPPYVVTVDLTPPAIPAINIVTAAATMPQQTIPSGGVTGSRLLAISGTAAPLSTVTVANKSTVLGQTVSDNVGSWSLLTSALPDDVYALTVTASDTAGNSSPASGTPFSVAIDAAAPTIAITSDRTSLRAGQTALLTFTLSEPAAGFSVNSVQTSGGRLTGFSGEGTRFTAVFEPTANSTSPGSVSVAANSFKDAVGNGNAQAALAAPISIDTVVPTVSIASSSQSLKIGETATITFALSEDSTQFSLGDVAVEGGTLSDWKGSGKTYTAVFTPAASSTTAGRISVADTAFVDDAGNRNAAGSLAMPLAIDTAAPFITGFSTLAGAGAYRNGATIDIVANMSEPVQQGASVSVKLSTGAVVELQAATSGTQLSGRYTVKPGENTDRLAVVSYTPGLVRDQVGNALTNGQFTNISPLILIDTTAPTVVAFTTTLPGGTYGIGAAIPLTAILSEPVAAGTAIEVTLNTGSTVTLVAKGPGVSLEGSYVVAANDPSVALAVESFKVVGNEITDAAGNVLTTTVPPSASANLAAISINGAIQVSAGAMFSTDARLVPDRRTAVSSIPLTFSAPVNGLSLSAVRLLLNGRSVSMRGASLSGSGANYLLRLPTRVTAAKGIYTLRILPSAGIAAATNGKPLNQQLEIYWGNGRSVSPAPAVRARAFAR